MKTLSYAARSPDFRRVPCAGLMAYSSLKPQRVGPGQRDGIIGLRGLGHIGVKLAHAMGVHGVLITTSSQKGNDAKKPGADEILVFRNSDTMTQAANTLD